MTFSHFVEWGYKRRVIQLWACCVIKIITFLLRILRKQCTVIHFCPKRLTVIHTYIHWWLPCKVQTSTSGAVWGSLSYPMTLRHADQGNQTSNLPITRCWLALTCMNLWHKLIFATFHSFSKFVFPLCSLENVHTAALYYLDEDWRRVTPLDWQESWRGTFYKMQALLLYKCPWKNRKSSL